MRNRKLFLTTILSVATILTSPGFMTPVVSYASEAKMESVSENTVDDFWKNPMEGHPSVSENAPEDGRWDDAERPSVSENAPEDGRWDDAERPSVSENAPGDGRWDDAERPSVSENTPEDGRWDKEERPSVSENGPQGNKGDKPEIKDEMRDGNKEHGPGKNEKVPDKNKDHAKEDAAQSDENRKLDEVTGLKVKRNYKKKISIKWNEVENADYYMVYRRNIENEEWECIKKTEKTSCTDNKLKAGEEYDYYVTACTDEGVVSEDSKVLETATKPSKPSLEVKKKSKNRVKITWDKTMNADSVEVYMKTGNGNYKMIAQKDASAGSVTKKIKAGKNYTFKIVAYTEAGEEKVYSAYSATKKIKMNK